ncbi:MAG: MFS transporter [Parachlamydiales bacterium]|nr:MFS transporter [Parachlamydiales bacterium]
MDPLQTKKTSRAYLWSTLFNAPFWALYGLLSFILYKDLHATAWQLSLFIALKPVVSLFSVYWSAFVNQREDRLRGNVIYACLIGRAPFFFFPWIDSPWFIIIASALYMMMTRGVIPAWMELLKRHLPENKREHLLSSAQTISYLLGVLLPFGFGYWMDIEPGFWRYLFPIAAFISCLGVLFQMKLPYVAKNSKNIAPLTLIEGLKKPWGNAYALLKRHPQFWRFQIGFALGGGGLMLMQPALPLFFVQDIQLSYTELAFALSACKGIGFALTSRSWAKIIGKFSLFTISTWVTLLATLFPLVLLLCTKHITYIYLAYGIYGAMQAGSELSWHLSGPLFAKENESSNFSSVNVLMVGLRGCIAPFLGSYLLTQLSATSVLLCAGTLTFIGSIYMAKQAKNEKISVI